MTTQYYPIMKDLAQGFDNFVKAGQFYTMFRTVYQWRPVFALVFSSKKNDLVNAGYSDIHQHNPDGQGWM